jgi:cytochrome c biogenesis protein CcmG, thiol:disulfide interchange protein DsbE
LLNLAGDAVTLSEFKGRPTLLVFWASWCPYCKKLLPGIAALNNKYAEQGLIVLAVNIKEDWKPEVYWRNHDYKFDTVLEGDEIAKIYGISVTPGLVFIAPSGQVLGVQQFSDPEHPMLERFAQEGIKLMQQYPSQRANKKGAN